MLLPRAASCQIAPHLQLGCRPQDIGQYSGGFRVGSPHAGLVGHLPVCRFDLGRV